MPTPANSNASLANSDSPLANSDVFPARNLTLWDIQWGNWNGQQEELIAQAAQALKWGHTMGVKLVCADKWAL
ncbi:hypothetical protein E4T56_gene20800 [Termitomyces sp. T112]|nr:hypothetical protein E4T56_gene20800 [Termitomyces sp. T112]